MIQFTIYKKLIEGDFTFRQLTIVDGTYKYNLLEKLKKIDPNSNLKYEDIPTGYYCIPTIPSYRYC